ncbi:uncharacterized protein PgNI_03290 [Pyricularia grisea]|uniref:Uncharacterized protein n=1 Tax=Pyricularia grisea TaxID=148305 RepID=A0A6P8B983_PYRGI|nr:uncharacterized protein PgNI_03290 [Pyricularia grisea]TLD12393.1 hypothetical protein PgNI_03290 [Pyricularia grisea]
MPSLPDPEVVRHPQHDGAVESHEEVHSTDLIQEDSMYRRIICKMRRHGVDITCRVEHGQDSA